MKLNGVAALKKILHQQSLQLSNLILFHQPKIIAIFLWEKIVESCIKIFKKKSIFSWNSQLFYIQFLKEEKKTS